MTPQHPQLDSVEAATSDIIFYLTPFHGYHTAPAATTRDIALLTGLSLAYLYQLL